MNKHPNQRKGKSNSYKKNHPSKPRKKFTKPEEVAKAPVYDKEKFIEMNRKHKPQELKTNEIRLNRYIAQSGICSRREADELIKKGLVKVNKQTITELGYKVKLSDRVFYKGKLLKREKNVYVLLNKPKGFITTTKDPEERKTVMNLVQHAGEERIYPVGRLDKMTTGLLLLTNDGELAKKLSHPSEEIQKIYHVQLDKPLTHAHHEKIITLDFELEDGPVQLDGFNLLNDQRTEMGIELHSGKNRIVRRIFEHFGYQVEKLDRVIYAGLTKKDVQRGKWRFLTEKEVIQLKYFVGKQNRKPIKKIQPPKEG